MNLLNQFCLKAYERAALYKEKMKKYHDQQIEKCEFVVRDLVPFYHRLHLFSRNHKSMFQDHLYSNKCSCMEKWSGRMIIVQGSR